MEGESVQETVMVERLVEWVRTVTGTLVKEWVECRVGQEVLDVEEGVPTEEEESMEDTMTRDQ